jgi:hypothetical protein
MEKLVEREIATRTPLIAAPALAVQFFLIPLAVVALTVMVYVGFRSLVADDRSAEDYLVEIRNGGTNRRWPAAYELSRMMSDPKVRADPRLGPALVQALEESQDGDPRARICWRSAFTRLPAQRSRPDQALDDPAARRAHRIWAWARQATRRAASAAAFASSDPASGKWWRRRAARGANSTPGFAARFRRRRDAAVALARQQPRGVSVLGQMLDRATSSRPSSGTSVTKTDPIVDV